MTYVKTYLPTLKTHVVNLKRDAKDLSRDSQRLEVCGKLGSKTLYCALVYVLRANCFGIIEKLAAAVRPRAKVVTTSVDKLPIHRLSCQLFSSCFDLI